MEHQPGTEEAQSYGRQLRERREEIGISQVELAKIAGVSRGTIRNAEGGMGLHAKTLANVLRALGCVPSAVQENAIVPVLTAGTMRIIAKVLLNSYGIRNSIAYDRRPYELEEWHEELTERFFKLMDATAAGDASLYGPARAERTRVPDDFEEFRSLLRHELDADKLREFDREMLRWFGSGYPYIPEGTDFRDLPTVPVVNPNPRAGEQPTVYLTVNQSEKHLEALRIAVTSSLPNRIRLALIHYLMHRMYEPESDFVSEIRVMIAGLATLGLPEDQGLHDHPDDSRRKD